MILKRTKKKSDIDFETEENQSPIVHIYDIVDIL